MTSERPDTRYLCGAVLTVDDSQRATNLTASTTAAYENNSARTTMKPTAGRALELKVSLDTADAGALLHIGTSSTASTALIEITDPGEISFGVGASYIATLLAPNASGTPRTYVIGWASEANPQSTGAGDAVRSELTVYDVASNTMARTEVLHGEGSPSGSMTFVIGGWWTGAVVANKVLAGTITAARVSARYHSRTELREHFVAQTAAPTVTGPSAVELQHLPEAVVTAGAIVGPQIQHAAQSMVTGRNRHRLAGPLVSSPHWPLVAWTSDLTTSVSASWVRLLPDGYSMHLGWVWRRRVPYQVDAVLPTVQWQTLNTEAEAVDVSLRVYCSSKSPHLAKSTEWASVELTRTTDDGLSGTGVLEQADPLQVLRDKDGQAWFWLGLYIVEVTPLATLTALRWLSLVAFVRPALGQLPPNAWGP